MMKKKFIVSFLIIFIISINSALSLENEIYKSEICISPLKSLSLHLTNINSSYGLSPFIDVKNLWDENK